MIRLALALPVVLVLSSGTAVTQAPLYVPLEEPWVPVSDADFWEYAKLMAAEFERYSSALTRHFQCLDTAWQNGNNHGRKAAAEHEVFVARQKRLRSRTGSVSLL